MFIKNNTKSVFNIALGKLYYRFNAETSQNSDSTQQVDPNKPELRPSLTVYANVSFFLLLIWHFYSAAVQYNLPAAVLTLSLCLVALIIPDLLTGYLLSKSGRPYKTAHLFCFGILFDSATKSQRVSNFKHTLKVLIFGIKPFCLALIYFFINSDIFASINPLAHQLTSTLSIFVGTLLIFDLLPIYPLTGYEILKELVSNSVKSYQSSTSYGRWIALIGIAIGIKLSSADIILFSVTTLLLTMRFTYYERTFELARGMTVSRAMIPKEQLSCLNHGENLDNKLDFLCTIYQPYLPVIYKNQLLGIVSRDRMLQLLFDGKNHYVTEFLEKDGLVVSPGDSLSDALESMYANGHEYATVKNSEDFLGLLVLDKAIELLLIASTVDNLRNTEQHLDIDDF